MRDFFISDPSSLFLLSLFPSPFSLSTFTLQTPTTTLTQTRSMSSWADIAAKNTPEELEAHPDTSLLEKKEDHPSHSGEQAVDYEAEHVHGKHSLYFPSTPSSSSDVQRETACCSPNVTIKSPSPLSHPALYLDTDPSNFCLILVVDQEEARKLREAMGHADESHIEDDFARAREHKQARDAAAQKARTGSSSQQTKPQTQSQSQSPAVPAPAKQAAKDVSSEQARLKAETQKELKEEVDVVAATAEDKLEKGKQNAQQGAKDAEKKYEEGKKEVKETYAEGKKEVKEKYAEGKAEAKEKYAEGKKVAEKKWEEGKQDAKEFAGKVEKEAKKDAKKVQKKASEVEREGRALAREYPYAATGIIGASKFPFVSSLFSLVLSSFSLYLSTVNVALVAVPAYYAYANWHHPRWDRRIVSAVAVGLTAAFGAESALGWFEYKEGHRPNL